jgi:proliferating cell nuclear antigen
VPELDNVEVYIVGSELQRGVKAAGMVSDHMGIGYTEVGSFYMRGEGDTDDVRLDLRESDGVEFLDETEEDVESLFSLDYLDAMSKELPSDEDVCTELGDDYPIKMTAELGEEGEMTYLLAPRIENE